MKRILTAKDINKTFGTGESKIQAVNHVSLTIQEGDFVSIMGPSGCGKSSLLHCLSAIETIDSGALSLLDTDINQLNDKELSDFRRKNLGFIFQRPTLVKSLDLLDNIIFPSFEDYSGDKADLIQEAKVLMRRLGLEGLENRKSHQVSGGQLQRITICRALLHRPAILFADEPTGALNSQASEEILNLFKEVNLEQMTILMVTHDAKVASQSRRVIFMKDGCLEKELTFHHESYDDRLEQIRQVMTELGV
ncbi:ABC transporter ATP-binding protein [Aerococcus urinae]